MKQVPTHAQVEVEVRYAETDQMGVVHHANYLVWFELARTRLCSLSGVHYAELEAGGHYLMVVGAQVRYRQGARYGDRVQVEAWVEALGSRGMTFAYEVKRDGKRLATGQTEHIWVDAASGRPCRAPERVRQPFADLFEGTVPRADPS